MIATILMSPSFFIADFPSSHWLPRPSILGRFLIFDNDALPSFSQYQEIANRVVREVVFAGVVGGHQRNCGGGIVKEDRKRWRMNGVWWWSVLVADGYVGNDSNVGMM
ncbi:hypothetical protein L2E82_29535 [Cichorium intybus]|uniref:Uncharacterized protein n=1 Tax=Cichorium intybus TaxID=13427 RepID=A0ACB9CXX1_CICIN|nr:hypothetical protein L2E82_29535 [Cichorium intybus]